MPLNDPSGVFLFRVRAILKNSQGWLVQSYFLVAVFGRRFSGPEATRFSSQNHRISMNILLEGKRVPVLLFEDCSEILRAFFEMQLFSFWDVSPALKMQDINH